MARAGPPDLSIIDLLRRPEAGRLAAALADDVIFSSPVADYHGRADVAHLLGGIARVLGDLVATEVISDGPGRTVLSGLTATVGGEPLEGILRERRDASGRLVHATLFLRPYRTLRIAISAMGELLSSDPLPSTRR